MYLEHWSAKCSTLCIRKPKPQGRKKNWHLYSGSAEDSVCNQENNLIFKKQSGHSARQETTVYRMQHRFIRLCPFSFKRASMAALLCVAIAVPQVLDELTKPSTPTSKHLPHTTGTVGSFKVYFTFWNNLLNVSKLDIYKLGIRYFSGPLWG